MVSVKDALSKPLGVIQQRKNPIKGLTNKISSRIIWRGLAALVFGAYLFLAGWIFFIDNPDGGRASYEITLEAIDASQPSDENIHAGMRASSDNNPANQNAGLQNGLKEGDALGLAENNVNSDNRLRNIEDALRDNQAGLNPRILSIPQDQTIIAEESIEQAMRDPSALNDGMAGSRLSIEPDKDLIEKRTGGGFLPKIGRNGARPMDRYARPFDNDAALKTLPKIAIIIGGMGLSQKSTQNAIRTLSPDVTLGFAPYGSSLDLWTRRAREEGFEYIVQMPMEPFDYPDNDPGPHTLLSTLDEEQNQLRSHWVLSRVTNYVGVMNHMGARFSADEQSFTPFLRDVLGRGLLYLDDGSSARSLAEELSETRPDILKSNVIIDQNPGSEEIENRLLQLEAIARKQGYAIGVGSAFPVTIDEVSKWSENFACPWIYPRADLNPIEATRLGVRIFLKL